MRIIDELRDEHRLIERVAGSLLRFAENAAADAVAADDVRDFARFMRVFVSGFHHEREEEVLFTALVDRAEVPRDRGPIAILMAEHRDAAALIDELQSAVGDPSRLASVARRLAHHLWEHLDKENSVLLPEAEQRLVRSAVTELDGRAASSDEAAARRLGEDIVDRFPPLDDPEVVRGDGCIACSAFAVTCGGIEKEWWSHWEALHYRSLDEG